MTESFCCMSAVAGGVSAMVWPIKRDLPGHHASHREHFPEQVLDGLKVWVSSDLCN